MKTYSNYHTLLLLFSLLIFPHVYAQEFTIEQEEMLVLVNELRNENGLEPLQLNANLNLAAQNHSEDLATKNFFSHTGSDGSSFGERVRRTDYEGFAYGENIATGDSNVENTFTQWKNSTGHRDNMLNSNINEMGLGYAYHERADYDHYWTQVFGRGDHVLSTGDHIFPAKNTITIFPNPAYNFININFETELKKASEVYLTNLTGQIIKQLKVSAYQKSLHINLANVPPGIYILQIGNDVSHKIVRI